jgi:HD superfamily phosphohydrolase
MLPAQEIPLSEGKLYQDQLYGTKVLSPLAVEIIDAPEFQRLAGLRQLGFADVAYRGARHSRFEHSVGTYFISRTIMRRIVQNHERLGLEHPGQHVSDMFMFPPRNSDLQKDTITSHSKWRGLQEVVSAAALLHDLGHVPFGHTLEDEFTGLFERHDSLAGPRFYQMLFDESSDLAKVFSDDTRERWIPHLRNEEFRRLIYVILSWKEDVTDTPTGFEGLLHRELNKNGLDAPTRERLQNLEAWHRTFAEGKMFHPFMSDIVGNTICADILDYLPRDRMNLGWEPSQQTRLQRYFTIRDGTLYKAEGLRMSIMVTRFGRGGQRKDVATAVLDIMRERYEMAERVFYHHKKAAASAMLAKLVELTTSETKPRDDQHIYPAPWTLGKGLGNENVAVSTPPHMTHLSDAELIDYLGEVEVKPERKELQKSLYSALRFRRKDLYRTLLVIDLELIDGSMYPPSFIIEELRGTKERPSNDKRQKLEEQLQNAAKVGFGEVIIYCPSAKMQSKEVDARLEIKVNSVLPLRVQRGLFAFGDDVEVLHKFYKELWRAYVFVSPQIYADYAKCKVIVDTFCLHFRIDPPALAYKKVRGHHFAVGPGVSIDDAMRSIEEFVSDPIFPFVPHTTVAKLLGVAAKDETFLNLVRDQNDTQERLSSLFEVVILNITLETSVFKLKKVQRRQVESYIGELLSGTKRPLLAARHGSRNRSLPGQQSFEDFDAYADRVRRAALGDYGVEEVNNADAKLE